MHSTIDALIEQLYGHENKAQVLASLNALMLAVNQTSATERRQFDERDIALITYGDSLRCDQQVPLQVLHDFLRTHLGNTLKIVHILPFHPFSSDDGFSVIDYDSVDPALGTWEHIHTIATDYELMADFVLNHMSAKSLWFRRFLADETDFASLFLTAAPDTDLSGVTRPRTSPLLTSFDRSDGTTAHVWTTFSADQVDFDYASPTTMLRMMDVLLTYVRHGATIIRLDAIAYLWKEIGTTSIHLPQTHAFVQLMRAVLDDVAPHVVLITETNVPHNENISYFGDGYNEAQMVYNFTLPPLLLHAMVYEDASKLREWAATLHAISAHTTFFNFTASHDGIGMRPLEGIVEATEIAKLAERMIEKGGRVSYRKNSDGTDSPYELNITYVDAVTDPALPVDLQVKQFMVSQAIMLALNGVPAVYIHSLLGSRNDVAGVARTGHNRAINRAKLDIDEIETALDDSQSFRSQVFRAYHQLLTARQSTVCFSPQVAHEILDVKHSSVFALRRRSNGAVLIALHNLSREAQIIDLSGCRGMRTFVDALTNSVVDVDQLTLPAFGVAWLMTDD